MSGSLRSSGGSSGDRAGPGWKLGAAVGLALIGVSATAYSLWPSARPPAPLPLDLRQVRGPGAPVGEPHPQGSEPASEPGTSTSTTTRTTHGDPPPGPPKLVHEAERLTVKPDETWPDVRTRLAKNIEAAALDVTGLTDPKARTASELGQAGSAAILALLCDDVSRGEEVTRDLGGETGALAGQPAAGRLAAMFAGSELDVANPRVIKPPRAMRATVPPITPPSTPAGEPKRRAMMVSMNKQQYGDQTQTTMSLGTPDLFPAVNAAEAGSWPSWEVRVPVKLGSAPAGSGAPCEAMVVLTRQPSGKWQPSNWGIVFHDASGADAFMKGIRARATPAPKPGGA